MRCFTAGGDLNELAWFTETPPPAPNQWNIDTFQQLWCNKAGYWNHVTLAVWYALRTKDSYKLHEAVFQKQPSLRWPRELNALQIEKTTSSVWQRTEEHKHADLIISHVLYDTSCTSVITWLHLKNNTLPSHCLDSIYSEQCLRLYITSTSCVSVSLHNESLIVFLNCKSLWIKVSAKLINVNVW